MSYDHKDGIGLVLTTIFNLAQLLRNISWTGIKENLHSNHTYIDVLSITGLNELIIDPFYDEYELFRSNNPVKVDFSLI